MGDCKIWVSYHANMPVCLYVCLLSRQWHYSGSMMFASEPLISVSGTVQYERVLKIQIQASPLRCRLIQMLRCSWSRSSLLCDWTLLPRGSNADMLFVLASLSCCYIEMGKSREVLYSGVVKVEECYVGYSKKVQTFHSVMKQKGSYCLRAKIWKIYYCLLSASAFACLC